jgi:hypothetical protein
VFETSFRWLSRSESGVEPHGIGADSDARLALSCRNEPLLSYHYEDQPLEVTPSSGRLHSRSNQHWDRTVCSNALPHGLKLTPGRICEDRATDVSPRFFGATVFQKIELRTRQVHLKALLSR